MLLEAQSFVRDYDDVSSVSLRKINRFKRCYFFFRNYYENKKIVFAEENNGKEIDKQKLNDNEIVKKNLLF